MYKTGDRVLGAPNYVQGPDGKTRLVFGSYDFFLHCVDAETGAGIWKYESADFINGSPCIDGAKTVVGGCDSIAHTIDLGNGLTLSVSLRCVGGNGNTRNDDDGDDAENRHDGQKLEQRKSERAALASVVLANLHNFTLS